MYITLLYVLLNLVTSNTSSSLDKLQEIDLVHKYTYNIDNIVWYNYEYFPVGTRKLKV